jgi:hypothetical protein
MGRQAPWSPWVHNEGVGTSQNDPAAVPPIGRHERIAALGTSRPSREVIAELEDRIAGDRFEVVFAIYKIGKPPLNHVENGSSAAKAAYLDFTTNSAFGRPTQSFAEERR